MCLSNLTKKIFSKMKNYIHHSRQSWQHGRRYRQWSILSISMIVILIIMSTTIGGPAGAMAEQEKQRSGLFSQMNNWFAKLRGNKDQSSQNSQDDKQKDEKKEEATTRAPGGIPINPMYPPAMAAYGMAPPGFAPMTAPSPFAGMVAAPGGPMFAPIAAMSTHQFATHHHPPSPRHMIAPHGFGPFMSAGTGGPISLGPGFSSYSAPSHLMPIHNDFSDSFGSFGGPYSSEQNDPSETFSSSGITGPSGPPMIGPGGHGHHHHHHHGHHHPPPHHALHHHSAGSDPLDSTGSSNVGYDDSYSKKRK